MNTLSEDYKIIQQRFYDKNFRQRCRHQPKMVAKELELDQEATKFVFNTKTVTYITMPDTNMNVDLREITAAGVSVGASTVSSASSAGTAFTVSCPSVTLSSASSAGSAASAGSVKGT